MGAGQCRRWRRRAGGRPSSWVPLAGLDQAVADEGVEVADVKSDVATDLVKADSAFGDQPADEPLRSPEMFRGLGDREQRSRGTRLHWVTRTIRAARRHCGSSVGRMESRGRGSRLPVERPGQLPRAMVGPLSLRPAAGKGTDGLVGAARPDGAARTAAIAADASAGSVRPDLGRHGCDRSSRDANSAPAVWRLRIVAVAETGVPSVAMIWVRI